MFCGGGEAGGEIAVGACAEEMGEGGVEEGVEGEGAGAGRMRYGSGGGGGGGTGGGLRLGGHWAVGLEGGLWWWWWWCIWMGLADGRRVSLSGCRLCVCGVGC